MSIVKAASIILALCTALAGCGGDADGGPVSPDPAPPTLERPGTLQAEKATLKSGGWAIPRSNADGAMVWHLKRGEGIAWVFTNLAPAAERWVTVRYSNDSFAGALEKVAILVDGVQVGTFTARDTGNFGRGWNSFTTSSPAIPLGKISGAKTLTLHVIAGDIFGIDVDSATIVATE